MVNPRTYQDRQLFFRIYDAVQVAAAKLIDRAEFDDRDIEIVDAAYARLQPRLETGEIAWENVGDDIRRYVAASLKSERCAMARRAARCVRATDDYDPIAAVADPQADVEQSVFCLEELEIKLIEAARERQAADQETKALKTRIKEIARALPEKERARFAAVTLAERRGEATYADVAEQVVELGFAAPDPATIRQWAKRFSAKYAPLLA